MTGGRAAARAAFLTVAPLALSLAYASDYLLAAVVAVVAVTLLVALVRYAGDAADKWATENIARLKTCDVEAWTTWHRDYVAWSGEHR